MKFPSNSAIATVAHACSIEPETIILNKWQQVVMAEAGKDKDKASLKSDKETPTLRYDARKGSEGSGGMASTRFTRSIVSEVAYEGNSLHPACLFYHAAMAVDKANEALAKAGVNAVSLKLAPMPERVSNWMKAHVTSIAVTPVIA
jgi:hypothetical protein